jgi:anti-sigma factor RsiW
MTTTPDCAACEPLLVRAAEATGAAPLDPRDRERLDAHLASCGGCRAALDAQVQMRALLASRPPLEASAAFRARLRQAIDAEAARTPSLAELLDFRRWTWRLAPLAAAMLLATGLGLSATLSDADATGAMTADAAALPVSAALYSTNVSDDSLLSLLLGANADERLGAVGTTEEPR